MKFVIASRDIVAERRNQSASDVFRRPACFNPTKAIRFGRSVAAERAGDIGMELLVPPADAIARPAIATMGASSCLAPWQFQQQNAIGQ